MTKIGHNLRRPLCASAIFFVLAMVAACMGSPIGRAQKHEAFYTPRLTLLPRVPRTSTIVPREADAARVANMLAERTIDITAQGLRRIEPAAAALLYNTAWGRQWVTSGQRGAIVQGSPPASCPALTVTTAPSRSAAIEQAINACRLRLATARLSTCDCSLLAVDDTLMAPLDAFAYAPGVDGRLLGLGQRYGGPLVVREISTGPLPGEGTVVFANAIGPLAEATLTDEGTARLTLLSDGAVYVGRRDRQGWSRGRLTERLLLTGPEGERIIALIGHDPATYARDGARLAQWPKELPR